MFDDSRSDREKMERFHAVMREKFGVKWDAPQVGGDGGAGDGSAGAAGEEKKEKPYGSYQGKLTNPNRKENEFMMNLMILRNSLMAHGPAVKERAKQAGPTVWRDIRMMTVMIDKIMGALQDTMPPERTAYYSAYARRGHYELRMDGPIRHEQLVLVSDRKLAAVYESAMTSECLTCMKEGNQIGSCLLRQCFMETIPPSKVQEDGKWAKCEYEDVARQLVQGKDVTI